ncbi:high-affinity K+ transport system ATPase subunit B [Pseudomonas baetica]|nr:high-affinity K+ transport system ATPase subunit B [Pseudomonas baetica]
MIIDVVTTKEGTMIKVMTVNMIVVTTIVVTMIAITAATAIAMTTTTDTFNVICSSCRAREAAFGCEAVVKSVIALRQADRVSRAHDCYAAERSLSGSAATTDRISA